MTAKKQAMRDIRNSLKLQGKVFIAFHKELDPVMEKLVTNHIKRQQCASLKKKM